MILILLIVLCLSFCAAMAGYGFMAYFDEGGSPSHFGFAMSFLIIFAALLIHLLGVLKT